MQNVRFYTPSNQNIPLHFGGDQFVVISNRRETLWWTRRRTRGPEAVRFTEVLVVLLCGEKINIRLKRTIVVVILFSNDSQHRCENGDVNRIAKYFWSSVYLWKSIDGYNLNLMTFAPRSVYTIRWRARPVFCNAHRSFTDTRKTEWIFMLF